MHASHYSICIDQLDACDYNKDATSASTYLIVRSDTTSVHNVASVKHLKITIETSKNNCYSSIKKFAIFKTYL